ncbi:MAG: protein kinase, partial [Gammaproteobacteria bacterium]|nr:protein kinase [Gammaproteobacteria bacterium]
MRDLQKGIELGKRYTLVRKLGAGAAAQTWLATDRLTRASVALKILVDDRIPATEFHKEWQTSIRLMHAHIVRVFEYNDDAEAPFYSMQFVDGADISALSAAPAEHILRPIGLVADALRYAHAKGVVHRDIKASNVLLDKNGAPYLIDFSAAAEVGADTSGGSLIAASPQALAGAAAQPADDLFALGGLIYELISGHSAYSSATTASDIAQAIPPPLRAADGSVLPDAVTRLVASMLDKDAASRPDAAAVAATLAAAGFPPAPAPKHYFSGGEVRTDEVIAVSDRLRPRTTHSAVAPATGKPGTGISPRTLGIGLAVLLAVLIAVIFVLPKAVTIDENAAGLESTTEETTATDANESNRGNRGGVEFSENIDNLSGRDSRVQARAQTEQVLGELLSKMDTLEKRAVQRWGGLRFTQAQAVYAEGDVAYLARDYDIAAEKYAAAIAIVDPLIAEVDEVFAKTLADAMAALDEADTPEAIRLFELAVAISPGHAAAQAGYARAKKLETVKSLTDQGLEFESDLELVAARESFARAVQIDPQWVPAQRGLERVDATIKQMEFDQRMTEGLTALSERDFEGARAAFRMAEKINPGSREPADGMLQVDQGIRLERIASLERQARTGEQTEAWEAAVDTYKSILEIDSDLLFAQQGIARAQQMSALHAQLDSYIAEPDKL